MRSPGRIKEWLSIARMFQWLQDAPDQGAYKRRMAIWLTHTGKIHANKVARILGVSKQAVWLWISQYNRQGPKGLERKGRGGRRWGFMSVQEEADLLKPLLRRARAGNPPKPGAIKQLIEEKLGKKVSMAYIYRLLRRHGWSEAIAQSKLGGKAAAYEADFSKLSHPWTRES